MEIALILMMKYCQCLPHVTVGPSGKLVKNSYSTEITKLVKYTTHKGKINEA